MGNLPLCDGFRHSTARFLKMHTVMKTALAYVGPEIPEIMLEFFLGYQLHHLDLKGGKARRIRHISATGQFEQFHMPSGMFSPPKLFAYLSCRDIHPRQEAVKNAGLTDAGVAGKRADSSLQCFPECIKALACLRTAAEHRKAGCGKNVIEFIGPIQICLVDTHKQFASGILRNHRDAVDQERIRHRICIRCHKGERVHIGNSGTDEPIFPFFNVIDATVALIVNAAGHPVSYQRRGAIQAEAAVYTVKEDEEDRDLLFVMDRFGYAKTMDPSLYEKNKEAVESGYKYYFICRSAGRICLFTNTGVLHTVKVSDLPMGKLRDKGVPIDNVGNYDSTKEEIVMACSQSDLNLYRLLFVTANGYVKIVSGGEFETRMKTMNATKLADGDSLVYAGVITDEKYAVLISRNGYLLKFPLEQISEMKKTAAGMQGMKLGKEDMVEKAIMIHDKEAEPLVYKETEVDLNRVRTSVRNGKGTKRF